MVKKLIRQSLNHPRAVVILAVFAVVAALTQYPRLKFDINPENMLPASAPVRVFHHETK